jgi:outer membrane protein assembly factor BamB
MKRILLIPAIIICLAAALSAVSTSFYEESGIRDFETGRFDGISVSENGELSLAPETQVLLDKSDLFVWAIARGRGGELYAATGVRGRIWRIGQDGNTSLFTSLEASMIRSLAAGPDGRVYGAASAPGRIIAMDLDGKQTILARLTNTYIHAIAFGQDGKLYAACGNPATLEQIDPVTGKTKRLFEAKGESHFLAMAIDKGGAVYLGSDGNGVLYKRSADGTVRSLYNAYEGEISAIALDKASRVFFATATQRRRPTAGNFEFGDSMDIKEKEQRRQLAAESDDNDDKKKKKDPLKNSVYRLNTDNSIDKIFTMSDTSFHSLAVDGSGTVYIGSGDLGVLYRVTASGTASRLMRVDENQILCLFFDGSRLLVGTGNDGRVRVMDMGKDIKGQYTSRVLDCRANVTFGSISWNGIVPAGAKLWLTTRSGNTNPPDTTWSDWSAPYTVMMGEKISNPRARYVQYRVGMQAPSIEATPKLFSLKIPFVHDNRQPRVRSVLLTTYHEAKNNKKIKLNPGQCLLAWQTEDDDSDTLATSIYFRLDNSAAWRLLKVDSSQNQVVLNSEMLPDGWYQFRVVASDRPPNPEALAKSGQAESRRVLIDNTAPIIENLAARVSGDSVIITGQVRDAHSHVSMLRYSLNSEDWSYVPSADGIFDSLTEEIRIELSLKETASLMNGSNVIFIRACDQQENWVTAGLTFTVSLPPKAAGLGNEQRYLLLD